MSAKKTNPIDWIKENKAKTVLISGAAIMLLLIGSSAGNSAYQAENEQQAQKIAELETKSEGEEQKTQADPEPSEKEEPSVPAEYKSALSQADTYANDLHLSKKGLYDQLVSEYGGQFKPEAAQYAVDNVKTDWNANALAQAKTYQNDLNLSPAAVRDQLMSEHGGQFTASEADYAIEHLND